MKRLNQLKVFLLIALLAGTALLARVPNASQPASDAAYATLGFPPMSATQIAGAIDETLAVYLLVLHAAFDQPDADAVRETLASIAHDPAIDQILETHSGSGVSANLQQSAGNLHDVDVLSTKITQQGDALSVLAIWQVVGVVSGTQHTHVRGNTYDASLTLAPEAGTWKITRFALGKPGQNLDGLKTNE